MKNTPPPPQAKIFEECLLLASFSNHFLSVMPSVCLVCKLFTFPSFSPEPLDQFQCINKQKVHISWQSSYPSQDLLDVILHLYDYQN